MADLDTILEAIAVEDIWGIGRRLSQWCYLHHIHNARQFKEANPGLIKQKMGVVGVRLQLELQGKSCLPLELHPKPKQETCVSRSFGQPITEWNELKEAIATYTTTAAEKLRKQQQVASSICVFIRTSPFKENYYSNSIVLQLPIPTNYTPELNRHAILGLQSIFREGCAYKKAGVMMLGLVSAEYRQLNLLEPAPDFSKEAAHMDVVDRLNQQLGKGSLQWAGAGLAKPWQMQRQWRSPCYTSNWSELPVVVAR
jgi:DNA polymerase V